MNDRRSGTPQAPSAPVEPRLGRRAAPAGRKTPGKRYLHRGHFAFFRALLEGIDLPLVWDRYLSVEGEHTDVRLVPATLEWMRAEFAAAAKREERPGTARLLSLDVQRLGAAPVDLPSLAQFAEEAGLEDESERDQLEAYQQRYGRATARQRRRARLLQRQLAALRWLEDAVAREPAAGDAIAAWLRPELAKFLGAADVFTLGQLAARINGIGKNWARSIRGIGPLKASRITAWIAEHQMSIGVPIGAHAGKPRHLIEPAVLAAIVEPATDVRPLEKLVVPKDFDGRRGLFRRPQHQCLLAADNDYDAILGWLRAKRGPAPAPGRSAARRSPQIAPPGREWLDDLTHTQRSYRKEAERFLLWAIVERRKALSSMAAEDCIAYTEFLSDPTPSARWCGPRARERWSPLWRPFEGPLSPSAQRQAIGILGNLYEFLMRQNYLMGNPWSAVTRPRSTRSGPDASRSLTTAQWRLVRQEADDAGEHSAAARLRLALDLLYATGLRTSEAVNAKVGDLQRVELFDAQYGVHVSGWTLAVVGKGGKSREVPVPDGVIAGIAEYLGHRGLQPDLGSSQNAGAYLLGLAIDGPVRAGSLAAEVKPDALAGISKATLYRQLKDHFDKCAARLAAAGEEGSARRLVKASTHWLRHTHATHALASGVSIQEAQQNLGHSSLTTTSAYVTTEKAHRMRSMQAFWAASKSHPQ